VKKHSWEIFISLLLLIISFGLYYLHFHIFNDVHHLFIYGLGELAFLPLEVLIVTLMLHRILEWHEKRSMRSKVNMLIGSFFSEVGNEFLRILSGSDDNLTEIREKLKVKGSWNEKQFAAASAIAKAHKPNLSINSQQLDRMKILLSEKRSIISELMQNPLLLEHRVFTDLLLATFHFLEELSYRDRFDNLGVNDSKHLAGDAERAYKYLICQWLDYTKHLKEHYNFLFSLAIRLNPLQQKIDVEVK